MAPFDASKLRAHFPALTETAWSDVPRERHSDPTVPVFFDAPGGVQVPSSVISAIGNYLVEANANYGGHFTTSKRTVDVVRGAREALADYLGAEGPDCIVIGANMTTLTFAFSRALAKSMGWAAGDNIVLTRMDHDANVSPWLLVARDLDMEVRFVDILVPECVLDLASLPGLLDARTRLVAVTYASNAVGTINPIKEIVATVRAAGDALVYVDAVHYAPHGLIDVQDLGTDFLACSVYKFFGPHLGCLYIRPALQPRIQPYRVRPAPALPPGSFETGTGAFELMAGAAAAVDYVASIPSLLGENVDGLTRRERIARAWGLVVPYEAELSYLLINGLLAVPGLTFYGIVAGSPSGYAGKRTPTVSFTLASHPADEVARYLASRNVCAWSGNFYAYEVAGKLGAQGTGLVRLGCASYTTREEVEHVVACVGELVAGKGGR
ncbi:cysteine desulfurase family protein [Hyaloraphidium curvatum]|nr:cysteine desulfurase family protein [Hyaloraphidium curvatum]